MLYKFYLSYLSVILSDKLTENMFSFAATTWGIVTGDEWDNCKQGIIRWPWWFEGQIGNLARTPGFNTPTLTISAMWSLMASESQDTRLTSHPKDGTLHRAVSPITALGHLGYFFLDQRKECLLLALQHHFQQHLVSPFRYWPGPTLLSFRSKPAVVCRVVCCWPKMCICDILLMCIVLGLCCWDSFMSALTVCGHRLSPL